VVWYIVFRPAGIGLDSGATRQLRVVGLDPRGQEVPTPDAITYASDSAAVASVSSTGLVTALAPGKATISATLTRGGHTLHAERRCASFASPAPGEVALTLDANGWSPSSVEVTTSETVRWRAAPLGYGGTPHGTLYLLNAESRIIDSLSLAGGTATRRFQTPGTYRYCTGGCWDAPEFGVIHVR
jgi:plastocyanin